MLASQPLRKSSLTPPLPPFSPLPPLPSCPSFLLPLPLLLSFFPQTGGAKAAGDEDEDFGDLVDDEDDMFDMMMPEPTGAMEEPVMPDEDESESEDDEEDEDVAAARARGDGTAVEGDAIEAQDDEEEEEDEQDDDNDEGSAGPEVDESEGEEEEDEAEEEDDGDEAPEEEAEGEKESTDDDDDDEVIDLMPPAPGAAIRAAPAGEQARDPSEVAIGEVADPSLTRGERKHGRSRGAQGESADDGS